MGKKPVAKAKAKEKEPEPEEKPKTAEELADEAERRRIFTQRREAGKWSQAQMRVVRELFQAAKERKNCDWLQIAHEFHEIRLIKLGKRLDEKKLDLVPQELKDGIEAYVAQCAEGVVIEQDGFRDFQEVWDIISLEDGNAYVRPAPSAEAEEAIKQIKVWSETTVAGIENLTKVMNDNSASAGAQEAGLVRLGGLFNEAREGASSPGLVAAGVMPIITAAMQAHMLDAEVQRSGCAALRGLAMARGQLPPLVLAGGVKLAVEGVRAHFKVTDVVMTATAAFWEMAKAAGKNSPELSEMVATGVVEILLKCMDHHAWDQTLCGKVRVVLPFIIED